MANERMANGRMANGRMGEWRIQHRLSSRPSFYVNHSLTGGVSKPQRVNPLRFHFDTLRTQYKRYAADFLNEPRRSRRRLLNLRWLGKSKIGNPKSKMPHPRWLIPLYVTGRMRLRSLA